MFNFLDKYKITNIRKLLQNKEEKLPIVILTGSGVSAESGIETFRGNGGLWNGVKIEEVCRPEGFEANPQLVIDFYNQRRSQLLDSKIKPNEAHIALARLEKELKEVYIITQNVDNLHERAGSKNIFHIHGELLRDKCNGCKRSVYSKNDIIFPNQCPSCNVISQLRPDVVFFKERPYFMREAEILTNSAKIFMSIGTSGLVYPAAGFVMSAKRRGALCIEINPNKTANGSRFDLSINRNAGESLPVICDELIKIIKG